MMTARFFFLALLLLALPLSAQHRALKKVRLSSGQEVALYSGSHALVIGVKSYIHWDRLINPLRDAHDVGRALERQGFEVTYLDDPDAEELRVGLNAFAYGEAGQDREARVVVFFAGHGHTEETASGQRGFILPRDVPRPESDRVDFMAKAVSMEDIEQLATGMLAKHVLFVFDSCFSGTLLRGTAHPGPITQKTTKKVRQFITSGSANEQVPDESVFKASLLNALDGDADQTGDGYVTGEELGWYLKGRVMEYTRGAQTPQYGRIRDPNLDQGDIVFVLGQRLEGASPGSEPAPAPLAVAQFDPLQTGSDLEDRMVYLPDYGFRIDKYEVTVKQYREFARSARRSMPSIPDWGRHEEYPVVNITWDEAEAYCVSVGKRLPTEEEWQRGCQGRNMRKYPWGDSRPDGTRGNYSGISDGYEKLAPVGSYPAGMSPDGVWDMAGNVWEWTASAEGNKRVLRGGSWADYAAYLRCASRLKENPNSRVSIIGFRCIR